MIDLKQVAKAALSSLETLYATYDLCRNVIERKIPGDFVECGVFGGAQCAAMAKALMDTYRVALNAPRVHLFDSFAGIPAGGEHDAGWTHPPGTSACSLRDVAINLAQWGVNPDFLIYHHGLFSETIPKYCFDRVTDFSAPWQISVLRIDCDLYESTKTCLEFLYPRVSPGGWVICDDFALPGARKAVLDYLGKEFPPVYWQHP